MKKFSKNQKYFFQCSIRCDIRLLELAHEIKKEGEICVVRQIADARFY
jgi:hypothetical protein